jgi:signal transduction histidine kinase
MNVLIVEDDKLQLSFIRHVLSRTTKDAIRLDAVTRLKEALSRLASQSCDVLLLGLQLPDSDGLDTFVNVSTAFPAIPIIILTGMNDEELAVEAVRRGAQDYLVKSELQEVTLLRSLRFAVERSRRVRAEHQMLEAQERERKRLSRELHDGVIQSLSSMRLQLQTLARETQFNDRKTSQCLTQMADVSLGAIDEVKRVCRDLHPAILETRDLGDAMILFGKRVQAESGVAIKVFDRCRGELSWRLKHHLYRIFQEAVRNAVRHAGAASVTVEYGTRDNKLLLEVRDHGQGFDVAAIERSGTGIGLTSLRERAKLMGGQAYIHSCSKKRGTVVRVEIPAGGDFRPAGGHSDDRTNGEERLTERETVAFKVGDTFCEGEVPDVEDADPRYVGR